MSGSSRMLFSAALWCGRLEEALVHPERRARYEWWLSRAEALGSCAADGHPADPATLARCMDDETVTLLDRTSRAAWDFQRLAEHLSRSGLPPKAEDVVEAIRRGNAANARRFDAAREWRLEDEARWLEDMLQVLLQRGRPESAADAFREISLSGKLDGDARRVARALLPLMVRESFGLDRAMVGCTVEVERALASEPGALESGGERLHESFFAGVAAGARRCHETAKAIEATREALVAACPAERSTSRIEDAVDALCRIPVVTTKSLARRVGLSHRGAQTMIERLKAGGALVDGTDDARNRWYVSPPFLLGSAR
jgi:hypothetical protein